MTTIMRFAGLDPSPWANGAGVTYEIARYPGDGGEFGWRLSVAAIDRAGPFSPLPGIDRTLVALGPHDLHLAIPAATHHLTPLATLAFPGEQPVATVEPVRPVRALNVMTRRGRVQHTVTVRHGSGPVEITGRSGAVIVLTGTATVDGTVLAPLDTLLSPTDSVQIEATGAFAVVDFHPMDRGRA
ncbi:HutD family protein [Actinoplanes sp. NPDC051851]|uniref:HutD/Ves family protein n=1 Tax=Actinoplanes sp. NPDC051851 TaxID=3154753 RepID=UPI00342F73E4